MKTVGYYENKILLTKEEYAITCALLSGHMQEDIYCEDGGYGIFDTYFFPSTTKNTNELATQLGLLRLRTYDSNADAYSNVSLELITKTGDILKKSRCSLPYYQVMDFISYSQKPSTFSPDEESAIEEISAYLASNSVSHGMYTSLKRRSFENTKCGLRVNFDTDVLLRKVDVNLYSGDYGMPVTDDSCYVMTVKHQNELPLWFQQILLTLSTLRNKVARYARRYSNSLKSSV